MKDEELEKSEYAKKIEAEIKGEFTETSLKEALQKLVEYAKQLEDKKNNGT